MMPKPKLVCAQTRNHKKCTHCRAMRVGTHDNTRCRATGVGTICGVFLRVHPFMPFHLHASYNLSALQLLKYFF